LPFCCARSLQMDRGMFAAARQSFNPIFKAAFHSITISGYQAQGRRGRFMALSHAVTSPR
jgi:hypothetical protein